VPVDAEGGVEIGIRIGIRVRIIIIRRIVNQNREWGPRIGTVNRCKSRINENRE
jgi:hypothetical protein